MSTEDLPPDDTPQGIRKPGEWPVDRTPLPEPEPEPDRRHTAVAAKFHITLGVLRSVLEEQPSPATVRAAGRRWINAATVLTEEVAKAMQNKKRKGDGQ